MWKDRIVEQVRRTREKIFADFDYDMKKYSNHIIEAQKKESKRLVSKEKLKELAKA